MEGERSKLGRWGKKIQTTVYTINNKDIPHYTGDYSHYLIITYN